MKIVFLTHPDYLNYQSIPRFTRMLAIGMKERGHLVEVWSPKSLFYKLSPIRSMGKWLGYIDQYIIFPLEVINKLKRIEKNTLFVFTDNALGPWVPLVTNRPHIIHCHDFLAQRSASGEIAENPTKQSGKLYQAFIHRGYSKGNCFISVSYKTKDDLHKFLTIPPQLSEVVYNGLNRPFSSVKPAEARKMIGKKIGVNLSNGYLLHVGGNEWYKNRIGVIEIYNSWRSLGGAKIPLLLIGKEPDYNIRSVYDNSPYKEDIYLLAGLDDETLHFAYSGALVLIFPSFAEGFGWPIAEAMASGCPVITTNEAPMTEVGGKAAFYISRKSLGKYSIQNWATEGARAVRMVLNLSSSERKAVVEASLLNAQRFDSKVALDKIEAIYMRVLMQNN